MTKKEANKDTKFWIHPDDFQKVINYAAASYNEFKSEIAGQMIVVPDEEGDFILKTPVIMEQTVSSGLCTLDETALAQYYAKTAMKHGPDVRFCWWHSHHTMDAFWSGTDNSTILDMPSKDWTVSLVVNLKKEYKLRIQFFQPFLHEENVELNFLTVDEDIDDAILAEVKEQCTKSASTFTYAKPGEQSYLPLGVNNKTYGYHRENDYSDGSYYGGYGGYSGVENGVYFNSYTHKHVNLTSIPQNVKNEADKDLIKLVDLCDSMKTSNDALDAWEKGIKPLNAKLKKYNVAVSTFTDGVRLEDAIISYWDDDYYENIEHKTEEIPF